jgi:hypothetical protein
MGTHTLDTNKKNSVCTQQLSFKKFNNPERPENPGALEQTERKAG